jgi:hypothetical protein
MENPIIQPSVLLPVLSGINTHERDSHLVFDEPTHKYTITTDPDSSYTSVTTWNHSHFSHFDADAVIAGMMAGKNWNPENKYWGKTAEEIKAQWKANAESVSGAGTNLHFDIECFMNEPGLPPGYTHADLLRNYNEKMAAGVLPPNATDEWQYFLEFVRTFPDLKPYRTEWMIYDEELKLAGSIDMVYENPDGSLMIYDWKRAKEISKGAGFDKYAITEEISHLPDSNYWHYSLQLNTYKAVLERKYGKTITALYLVRLHPNNKRRTYDLIKCCDLSEEIQTLFDLRAADVQKM